jgi:hypothetical protein
MIIYSLSLDNAFYSDEFLFKTNDVYKIINKEEY